MQQQIMTHGCCLYIWIPIYYYITANNVVIKPPRILTIYFLLRNISEEYPNCFSQYQRYLCNIFSLLTYLL